ncbi:hypothetical protein BaRGS_00030638 [Batillaria attramentaria]|uniref:Uncharacterized protein n=1 Tax=Batillaria attramentaria TaxID=370345 RepID=A0ABD0JSJ2_9CAEN
MRAVELNEPEDAYYCETQTLEGEAILVAERFVSELLWRPKDVSVICKEKTSRAVARTITLREEKPRYTDGKLRSVVTIKLAGIINAHAIAAL